jgi:hypothetical protein
MNSNNGSPHVNFQSLNSNTTVGGYGPGTSGVVTREMRMTRRAKEAYRVPDEALSDSEDEGQGGVYTSTSSSRRDRRSYAAGNSSSNNLDRPMGGSGRRGAGTVSAGGRVGGSEQANIGIGGGDAMVLTEEEDREIQSLMRQ